MAHRVVAVPAVVDEDALEVLVQDVLRNRPTPAPVYHEQSLRDRGEDPQPIVLPVNPPAGLVATDGLGSTHQGFYRIVLVPELRSNEPFHLLDGPRRELQAVELLEHEPDLLPRHPVHPPDRHGDGQVDAVLLVRIEVRRTWRYPHPAIGAIGPLRDDSHDDGRGRRDVEHEPHVAVLRLLDVPAAMWACVGREDDLVGDVLRFGVLPGNAPVPFRGTGLHPGTGDVGFVELWGSAEWVRHLIIFEFLLDALVGILEIFVLFLELCILFLEALYLALRVVQFTSENHVFIVGGHRSIFVCTCI